MNADEAFDKWVKGYPNLAAGVGVRLAFEAGWYAREELEFELLVRRAMPEALAQARAEVGPPGCLDG